MQDVVLSYAQAERLVAARRAAQRSLKISPDLGLSTVTVTIAAEGASFPDGQTVSWKDLDVISRSKNVCFAIEGNRPRKIQLYSERTDLLYSLMPTEGAPTMLVSGIPMHRIKGTDPHRDTLEKIKTIAPLIGQVLDTATGLGYTAIEAATTAERVLTIELDPAVLEIARLNPWSLRLFESPNITRRIGDSTEVVQELCGESFSRIIHDPPAFRLAGDLYSGEFYRHLFRVLRRGGRLFHYVGDPRSKSGRSVTGGVVRRLEEAGFSRIVRCPRAYGLVATK